MSLVNAIQEAFDQRTRVGQNMRIVAQTAEDHPQSGLKPALTNLLNRASQKRIGKIDRMKVTFHGPSTTEDATQKCTICGKEGLKTGHHISITCNGTNLNEASAKDVVGTECYKRIVWFARATQDKELTPAEFENKKSTRNENQTPTIQLANLMPEIADLLATQGYDLQSTIPRDKATEYERQIKKGDYTGIAKELDPAKNQDMTGWIIGQFQPEAVKANGPFHTLLTQDEKEELLAIAMALELAPQTTTEEEKTRITNLYDQTRPIYSRDSLQGTIDDIKYLAELTATKPTDSQTKEVKIYDAIVKGRRVYLSHKAERRNDHKKTEPQTLESLVNNTTNFTAAQAAMMTLAVPGLRKRRKTHNQIIMDEFADEDQWKELLKALERKYATVKTEYHEAKKAKIDRPQFNWKNYTPVMELFKEIELGRKADPDYDVKKHILHTTTMRKAEATIREFYVEARKVQLANHLGKDEALGKQYMTVSEAIAHLKEKFTAKDAKMRLASLPRIAIEETPTKGTKTALKGTPAEQTLELIADVTRTMQFDLIPTKYVQSGRLEKALYAAVNYTEDVETTRKTQELARLEGAGVISLKYADQETGKAKKNNAQSVKIQQYNGKTHFTTQQREIIDELYRKLLDTPAKDLTDNQLQTFRQAKEYYKERRVLDKGDQGRFLPRLIFINESLELSAHPIKVMNYGEAIAHYQKKEEHTELTEEQKRKLQYLEKANASYSIAHLTENAWITPELRDDINERYETAIAKRINEGAEHYRRKSFTIAISGEGLDTIYRGKGLKLREARSEVHLGRHTTIRQGEWYGQSINKATLNTIVEQLPDNAEIRIKPD